MVPDNYSFEPVNPDEPVIIKPAPKFDHWKEFCREEDELGFKDYIENKPFWSFLKRLSFSLDDDGDHFD